jgi:hypothetical protein
MLQEFEIVGGRRKGFVVESTFAGSEQSYSMMIASWLFLCYDRLAVEEFLTAME